MDVRKIRKKTGLSQIAFAEAFGLSAATVRDWEQGRRQPVAHARVLLLLIDADHERVMAAIKAGPPYPQARAA